MNRLSITSIQRAILFGILAVVVALLSYWVTSPNITVRKQMPDGSWAPLSLPFDEKVELLSLHRFRVHFDNTPLTNTSWRFFIKDHLTSIHINGKELEPSAVPNTSRFYTTQGTLIELSPWVRPGVNEIEIGTENFSNFGGFDIRPDIPKTLMVAIWISFLIWVISLQQVLNISRSQFVIISIAIGVLLLYWQDTSWNSRGYDMPMAGGHLGYVRWVAGHLAIPRPDAGWTYFHPPLYYILGACVIHLATFLGVSTTDLLQLFSLAMWIIFLMASAACLHIYLKHRPKELAVATLALAFWPAGIIASIRLGNDVPTYACCALATYSLLIWWKTRHTSAFVGICVWSMLALLFKTSAIAVIAASGSLILWRCFITTTTKRRQAFTQLLTFSVVCAVALTLSLGNNIYHYLNGDISEWLVGNADGLPDAFRVINSVQNFIGMDIATFLSEPWNSINRDYTSRNYFWNYLLRSSMTGEFKFEKLLLTNIALMWGGCLLILGASIIAYLGRLAYTMRHNVLAYRLRPLLILSIFWVASIMALRLKYPFACSNDFRYILPVLIPATIIGSLAGRLSRLSLTFISLGAAVFFTNI